MPPNPQQLRSRGLVLTAAISVALVSTGSAYLAMVAFGIDVLEMNPGTAYATAGVFELSLVTVALLAREAAKDNRPGGVLLTLTWMLSSASGAFAAWHELFVGHPVGAAIFRFLVPLLAALMWHLALIGDRHLATGMSWSGARQARRMHALFLSTEDLFRAQSFHDGSRGSRRRLLKAEAVRRRARAVALRTVPPEEMRSQVAAWSEAMAAVGDGTADVARLHVDDRRRLTALLVDDGAPRVPGDDRRAAEIVSAEIEAAETRARIAAARSGEGRVIEGSRPAPREAGTTTRQNSPVTRHRPTEAEFRAPQFREPTYPQDEPEGGRPEREDEPERGRPDREHEPAARGYDPRDIVPALDDEPAARRFPVPVPDPADDRPRRRPGEGAAAAVAALTGAAPHAAGVRPIGAPAPDAPPPVRPPTGAIPIATVQAASAGSELYGESAERRRPAAREERRTEVRSAAPDTGDDTAARRPRPPRNVVPERQPGTPLDEAAVNRIIDLFAQGATVKSIAEQMRVSESTVRKRLKDFEATGSIPVVGRA
ncbi:helix-turn-helix domain-containing protein [Myceligenerans crystallogenes]|uniref:Homeodomain-like domain-containing protein n=1 Tax=Myceligenerans crystallogenes TaxID=316335 RepID=A0ABN2NAL3_9MICO